jgi:hypothetical protein
LVLVFPRLTPWAKDLALLRSAWPVEERRSGF